MDIVPEGKPCFFRPEPEDPLPKTLPKAGSCDAAGTLSGLVSPLFLRFTRFAGKCMSIKSAIKSWIGIPPWILIGAVVVLFPIFSYMTFETIHQQRERSLHLLREKGASLIRAFEAGTRTGMMGRMGEFQLQKLLMETALQPDIVHLIVTDVNGTVLASSDPSQIGQSYGLDLDLHAIVQEKKLRWRMITLSQGISVCEVYRRFTPTEPADRFHKNRFRPNRPMPPIFPFPETEEPKNRIIFIGLDTTPVEEAMEMDMRHTIVMSIVLLMIGISGVLLLFLVQGYRSARQSLSRIKALSDTLVQNMPLGVIALDTANRMVMQNPAARSLFSGDNGSGTANSFPASLLALLDDPGIQGGPVVKTIEFRMGDAEPIPIEAAAARLVDDTQSVIGHVILLKDLREVESLRKALARSRRLAAIGSLAAGVAHEIRNPLSSIKGFATYFRQRYGDIPEDNELATLMIQEVERLNRVVTQLIDFSKPVALATRPCAPLDLVKKAVALVERQAEEKGIHIDIRHETPLPAILVDPDRMNQVLLNLLLNAMEAIPSGGAITLSIEPDKKPRNIAIRIRDTGDGIPAEHLSRIFDPYYTTKSTGTGLGLAIVHQIIEAHQGEIQVFSDGGIGTTVCISIPQSAEQPGGQTPDNDL
jgi:two-component system sensor histidine kinase HydH